MAIFMLKCLVKWHKICKLGDEKLKMNKEPQFQHIYFFGQHFDVKTVYKMLNVLEPGLIYFESLEGDEICHFNQNQLGVGVEPR